MINNIRIDSLRSFCSLILVTISYILSESYGTSKHASIYGATADILTAITIYWNENEYEEN